MQATSRRPRTTLDLCLKPDLVQDNDPVKVRDKLWIGSIHAAFNLDSLLKHGVTHVLNASGLPATFPRTFTYFNVEVRDKEEADILGALGAACIFIEAGIEKGGVLVHCAGGRSRSAAFIAAYLMTKLNYTFDRAVELIRSVRPVIAINKGFEQQLRAYEATGQNVSQSHQLMLRARMHSLMEKRQRVTCGKGSPANLPLCSRRFSIDSTGSSGGLVPKTPGRVLQGTRHTSALRRAIEPRENNFLPLQGRQTRLRLCRPYGKAQQLSSALPELEQLYICSGCGAYLLTQGNILDITTTLPDISLVSPNGASFSVNSLAGGVRNGATTSWARLKASPKMSEDGSDLNRSYCSRSNSFHVNQVSLSTSVADDDEYPRVSRYMTLPSFLPGGIGTPSLSRGCRSTTNFAAPSLRKSFGFDMDFEEEDTPRSFRGESGLCSFESLVSSTSFGGVFTPKNESIESAYTQCDHEEDLSTLPPQMDFGSKRDRGSKRPSVLALEGSSWRSPVRQDRWELSNVHSKSSDDTRNTTVASNHEDGGNVEWLSSDVNISSDPNNSLPLNHDTKITNLSIKHQSSAGTDSVESIFPEKSPWLYTEYISWMGDMVSATSSTGTLYCPNPSCGIRLGEWSWEPGAFNCPITDCLGPTIALDKNLVRQSSEKNFPQDGHSSSRDSTPRSSVNGFSEAGTPTAADHEMRRGSGILEMRLSALNRTMSQHL